MLVKMSLLWFYLRLDHRRYMRWSVYGLMFIVLGLSVPSFFILAFNCSPPSKFWDVLGTQPGSCMAEGPQQDFYNINGILNIVTDILIYLIPIPMLWRLQISGVGYSLVFLSVVGVWLKNIDIDILLEEKKEGIIRNFRPGWLSNRR